MKGEKYKGKGMLKMEVEVEISHRIIRKGLTKWHFSRNPKEMWMQALGIWVGSNPKAEEAGKYKSPRVELYLVPLRKSGILEELKHCEWRMVDRDSWEEVTEVVRGQIIHYPSRFYPIKHGNSMENFAQRSETIWLKLLKNLSGHCWE